MKISPYFCYIKITTMKVIEVIISNCLISRLMMFAIVVPETMPFEQIENLHKQFEAFNPDCHVNFHIDSENFICGMPVNMKLDEKRLTFDQFMAKWYSKTNFTQSAQEPVNTGTDMDLIDSIMKNLNLN